MMSHWCLTVSAEGLHWAGCLGDVTYPSMPRERLSRMSLSSFMSRKWHHQSHGVCFLSASCLWLAEMTEVMNTCDSVGGASGVEVFQVSGPSPAVSSPEVSCELSDWSLPSVPGFSRLPGAFSQTFKASSFDRGGANRRRRGGERRAPLASWWCQQWGDRWGHQEPIKVSFIDRWSVVSVSELVTSSPVFFPGKGAPVEEEEPKEQVMGGV